MIKIPKHAHNLSNKKFNSLLVISPERIGGNLMWRCKCDCGKIIILTTNKITSGHNKTCGCGINTQTGNIKHGLAKKVPEYSIWKSMRQRCNDVNCKSYKNYGGRGIKVSDRWDDFGLFLLDMGSKPSAKHTLDRIDVNGNYEPSNCRWATWEEQQRNRSNNRLIEFNGRSYPVAKWNELLGFPKGLINTRLHRGWNIIDALSIAPRRSKASV